jgi:hypothetical protein
MKSNLRLYTSCLRASKGVGLASLILVATSGYSQLLPAGVTPSQFTQVIGNRVEATAVLGGDYGATGGTFKYDNHNAEFNLSKFGGGGDQGDPRPIGDSGLAWQPRIQGSLGYLAARVNPQTPDQFTDVSRINTFAIEFGGGIRFWFGDHLSLCPTIMGMYGNSKNSYTANNPFTIGNWIALQNAGFINWYANTWSAIPAGDAQWVQTFGRTIFTLNSTYTYYHTESFNSSPTIDINGNSQTWKNKLDVDIPLGKELLGHELRTGGYFSRTEFFGGIQDGLNADHQYEIHGRLVLDFLGELWKVQWIGIGASYLWSNTYNGYSFGADIAFRF